MSFSLTAEQTAIVNFIAENPTRSLMADARAGAAKTSTIVAASQGIQGGLTVLALAFNKRIADELKLRLPERFDVKTLNGLGHTAWGNVVRKRMSVDVDKMFKLARKLPAFQDDPDGEKFSMSLTLAKKAKSVGLVPKGAPLGKKGLVEDHPTEWEEIGWGAGFTSVSRDVIDAARTLLLQSIKAAYNAEIDFDDQVYMSALFDGVFPRYHTVIVDEAQDLSALNHRMLLKATGTRLIAIGDPYQAIYAFRGADSQSMTNLMELFTFERLGLTASFRVPHLVSARQLEHVADFTSHSSVRQGSLEAWNRPWSISELPNLGAVLCRNNAPIVTLAYRLIRAKRPVTILGRDIGAALAKTIAKVAKKAGTSSVGKEFWEALDQWREAELAKVTDSESKAEVIRDRAESMSVLVEASEESNIDAVCKFVTDLFSDKAAGLTLSSGHRAKGLEWDWVLHLDPWRVPSRAAQRSEEAGNPGPMIQERNLKYVIETRTKDTLVVANLADCKEA